MTAYGRARETLAGAEIMLTDKRGSDMDRQAAGLIAIAAALVAVADAIRKAAAVEVTQ